MLEEGKGLIVRVQVFSQLDFIFGHEILLAVFILKIEDDHLTEV